MQPINEPTNQRKKEHQSGHYRTFSNSEIRILPQWHEYFTLVKLVHGTILKIYVYIRTCTYVSLLIFAAHTCIMHKVYMQYTYTAYIYTHTPTFMYVCMYVYTYVCTYVCMHACHVCMYVCMYVCMHACMYAYIYICTHTGLHAYARVHQNACMQAHVAAPQAYIHIHTRTCNMYASIR